MRRSMPASSRSHTSAVLFAWLRFWRRGFFSASSFAIVFACSRAICWRSSSMRFIPSSIRAIRNATSFCSCSSFFSATISLRSSGKFAASAVPSRPRLISLLCRRRRSCRSAMRVFWRLSFNATSRKPVRMKLTRRRYTNPEREKDFSCPRSCTGQTVLFLTCCQLCQHTEVFQRRCVPGDFCPACNFFEEPSHDFAAARFRKRFGKTYFIGFCNCANVLAHVIAQFFFQCATDLNSAFHCHKRDNALTL